MLDRNTRGAVYTRILDDGRMLDVIPQLFNAMLGVSENEKADIYLAEY